MVLLDGGHWRKLPSVAVCAALEPRRAAAGLPLVESAWDEDRNEPHVQMQSYGPQRRLALESPATPCRLLGCKAISTRLDLCFPGFG